jgi:hypothetical protein
MQGHFSALVLSIHGSSFVFFDRPGLCARRVTQRSIAVDREHIVSHGRSPIVYSIGRNYPSFRNQP